MIGTLLNVALVIVGGLLGVALGGRLPGRVRGTLTDLLGLFVLVLGISDALVTFGPELGGPLGRAAVLVVLGSLLVGGVVGELIDIDAWLTRVGERLRDRVLGAANDVAEPEVDSTPHAGRTRAAAEPAEVAAIAPSGPDGELGQDVAPPEDPRQRFVEGFVITTLIVCVGPLALLGSLQEGLTGDYQLLAVKGVLDGSVAVAFGSVLGIGVIFSALPLLVWQGGLALAAGTLGGYVTDTMLAGLTAVGGFLVLGIGLRLLELRAIRVANLLPALVIAPVVIALWP